MVSPRKITSDQRELCKNGFLAITPLYITIILNQSAGPIKAIFHRQHQYESGTNMCIKSRSNSQDGLHDHIMQKNRCPCKNGFINDNDNCRISGVCGWDFYIKSFCFMCSPVEHYFCFYLRSLLYDFEDVPRKNSFRRCPQKNDKLCPRKIGLSSYLSPVTTIIDVPGKVVYLHYTTVYCACLSVVLVAFRSC